MEEIKLGTIKPTQNGSQNGSTQPNGTSENLDNEAENDYIDFDKVLTHVGQVGLCKR